MKLSAFTSLLTSLLCLAVVGGCGDSGVNVDEAESLLVLRAVDGEPLPASVENRNPEVVFVADSIWLLPGSRWYRVERTRLLSGVQERDVTSEREGTVRLEDDALVLSFVCRDQPDALCVPPDRLTQEGPHWVIDRGGVIFRFENVGPPHSGRLGQNR